MDVILLNEALRSFKPDITPEQATTDVVTGRVARAAAALYDACGALNEGAPSSKVLAAIDDAQLATRGWSRVLAGKGSSTPLLCCPEELRHRDPEQEHVVMRFLATLLRCSEK